MTAPPPPLCAVPPDAAAPLVAPLPPAPRRLSREQLATALALAFALALRLWGLCFSASTPRGRPDEEIFLIESLRFFARPNPTRMLELGYPNGYVNLAHLLERAEAALLPRLFGSEVNLGCLHALHPLALALPLRLVSALAGTLACLVVGRTARRLVPAPLQPLASVLGVLALACNYLAGRESHFAITEAVHSLLLALTLYLCVRALRDDARFLCAAAAAAGAAFAVKFSAVSYLLPCLAAGAGCVASAQDKRRALGCGLLALPSAALGFALLSPSTLLHPAALVQALLSHAQRFDAGTRGAFLLDPSAAAQPGIVFFNRVVLPVSFGWAGLLLAAAGLLVLAARDRRAALVLFFAALGAEAVVAKSAVTMARYIAPAVPPLAVALAVALAAGAALLHARFPRLPLWAAAALLCVPALGPPLARLCATDRLLSRPDTRDEAAAYLAAQGGSVVSQGSYGEHVHAIEPGALAACANRLPAALVAATSESATNRPAVSDSLEPSESRLCLRAPVPLLPSDTEQAWLAWAAAGPAGYADLANAALWDKIVRHQDAARARFVVQAAAALPCGRLGRRGTAAALDARCFVLDRVFSPGTLSCDAVVDLFDSFYVPFGDPAGQERPGPEVRIYRNICERAGG